jgi:Fe-Mn family superoxide dismutase
MGHFLLPELPYEPDSLMPHISPETIGFHHGKHQQAYITRLNSLIRGTPHERESLEEIIRATECNGLTIFDNATEAWNHTFYWHSLCPNGSRLPYGPLFDRIARDFGSLDALRQEFSEAGRSHFGSGWAWLVRSKGKRLEIVCSSNAESPLVEGQIPLLTCDLWEHAYYIDYRNAKDTYFENFWKIANWSFASVNFAGAGIPDMTRYMRNTEAGEIAAPGLKIESSQTTQLKRSQ